jgi:hypothetical protein
MSHARPPLGGHAFDTLRPPRTSRLGTLPGRRTPAGDTPRSAMVTPNRRCDPGHGDRMVGDDQEAGFAAARSPSRGAGRSSARRCASSSGASTSSSTQIGRRVGQEHREDQRRRGQAPARRPRAAPSSIAASCPAGGRRISRPGLQRIVRSRRTASSAVPPPNSEVEQLLRKCASTLAKAALSRCRPSRLRLPDAAVRSLRRIAAIEVGAILGDRALRGFAASFDGLLVGARG